MEDRIAYLKLIADNIQKEYLAIKKFSSDWYKPLTEKYNITYEELLDIIQL